MLSSSRFSASAVTWLPVSEDGDVEHLAGHRLLEAVDARDAVLDLEERPDLFDIELVKVSSFDLPKQDVFDFARSERRVGCHTQ